MTEPTWGRYEELRPDQLDAIVRETPVACWGLGLLECHGWHLPVGFDGVKAERVCRRVVEQTGGVLLPTMWWGGEGGHGDFRWTFYQPRDAYESIFENTVRKLLACGFRCFVFLAGHYPWQAVLGSVMPGLEQENPDALFIYGTEANIGAPELRLHGDHAALWETTYGLALLPELVDMDAMRPGRTDADAWLTGSPPPEKGRHPGVSFDPTSPLFAQMGKDSREADAEQGRRMMDALVDHLAGRVRGFVAAGAAD